MIRSSGALTWVINMDKVMFEASLQIPTVARGPIMQQARG